MTQDAAASTDSWERLSNLTESHMDLLNQVNISLWTTLPIPNEVAVQVIALYLNNDYPVLPLFDADLFLRDLVHNQPYFCSSFLITALLAWACQAYTPVYAEAAHYSSACFVDAQAQWSKYGDRESITLSSVSALQLLCMTAVTYGKDELAFEYLHEGLRVAQSMGLLNLAPGTEAEDAWFSGYTEWMRAASYTAWGAFNWISLFSLHYHKSEVEFPPRLFMPGDIDVAMAGVDNKQVMPHPSVEAFRASSSLWTIFLVVTKAYYGKDTHILFDQHNALVFAEGVYQQLLVWADKLPTSLVRCPGSDHATYMLQ
ncbi:NirA-like nitrate assimilation regulatory protein [Fusarium denticulatum]|uniref:NirA-like nitrate assimilation regulatory protein n=1 Tax=Fusarium denticulatum TaxID=48507 RepID=A0A8H5WZL7_9HYPO|nr:NirA-like nitrate assimilation regulatory protein [Fusarium denticulatum]